jgi:hypothetical protein
MNTTTQPPAVGEAAHTPTPKWHEDTKGLSWSRNYGNFSAEVSKTHEPFQPVVFWAWLSNGGPDGTHSENKKFTGRGSLLKAKAAADEMARAALARAKEGQPV